MAYSEILPWDISPKKISLLNPKGVILSGGPESVTKENTPRIPETIFSLDIPILGICYGMQTLAEQSGGSVNTSSKKEFGYAKLRIEHSSMIFNDINSKTLDVWMSHGDHVSILPDDFILSASTESAPIAAMEHKVKPYYALQFHPEVTHTDRGNKIIENFVVNICNSEKKWRIDDLIDHRIEEIKTQVGDKKVLLGLSGGVDSSVTAMLLDKAIGKNLICMFVDNGLLRKNEVQEVINLFKTRLILISRLLMQEKHFTDTSKE